MITDANLDQEPQRGVLIAIHGVGFHKDGAIREGITNCLGARYTSIIKELNWSNESYQSDGVAASIIPFVPGASRDFAVAASIGFGRTTWTGKSLSPLERSVHNILFIPFQTAVAFSISSLILLPFIFSLGLIWSAFTTDIGWRTYLWLGSLMPKVLQSIGIITLTLLVGQILIGILGSLCRRRVWPLLMVARRLTLSLVSQFTLAVTFLLNITPAGAFGLGVAFFVLVIPPFLADFPSDAAVTLGQKPLIYPLLVAAIVLANGAARFGLRLLGAAWLIPLKILLDIVRYIGDASYQSALHDSLREEIDSSFSGPIKQGRRIVIAAHSLGSVIALDALFNATWVSSMHSIILITAGSPLKRFFFRFFPDIFFPSSAGMIGNVIRSKVEEFKWINIYRPLDYVGTTLGLSRSHLGTDVSTSQWHRVVDSHSNYWGDPIVAEAVQEQLSLQVRSIVLADREPCNFYIPDTKVDLPGEQVLSGVLRLAKGLFIFLLFAMYIIILFVTEGDHSRIVQSKIAPVVATGEETSAQVSHWQVIDHHDWSRPGEFMVIHEHLLFEFTTIRGEQIHYEITTDPRISFSAAEKRIDVEAVKKFVREACKFTQARSLFALSDSQRRCRRSGIIVKYLADEPQNFITPSFPGQKGLGFAFGSWITIAGFIFWLTVFSSVAASFVGLPILNALLGVKACK